MLAKSTIIAAVVFAAFSGETANAQTLVEQSAEVRMQLDLAVSPQALKALLPEGWEPVGEITAAANDCNVPLIFVDGVGINGPDGAPAGTEQMVYFASPIKKTGSNETMGQMVVDGITSNPKSAHGPF